MDGTLEYQKNASTMFKDGLAQAASKVEAAFEMGKDNFNALVASSTAAQQGAETIQEELVAFSKKSFDDVVATGKAAMACKSPVEFFELQQSFFKSSFDAYVGQVEKLTGLYTETSKSALAPLKSRAAANVQTVQDNTAPYVQY